MATFTIKSRKFGNVVFSVRDDGRLGYIRVSCVQMKWENKQICQNGCMSGVTLMGTTDTLEHHARKWWRSALRARNA